MKRLLLTRIAGLAFFPGLLLAQYMPLGGIPVSSGGGGGIPAGWTAHFDASVSTQMNQLGGPPCSTAATSGLSVGCWNNPDSLDWLLVEGSTGNGPVWNSAGINGLGSLVMDGLSSHAMLAGNEARTTNKHESDWITASAFTIIAEVKITGACTNGSPMYNNEMLLGDAGPYMGLYCQTITGAPNMCIYTWDGAAKSACTPITLNTPYTVVARHDSGSLVINTACGTDTSTAAGNTVSLTNNVQLMVGYNASAFVTGQLGEFHVWNTVLSSGQRSAACAVYATKW